MSKHIYSYTDVKHFINNFFSGQNSLLGADNYHWDGTLYRCLDSGLYNCDFITEDSPCEMFEIALHYEEKGKKYPLTAVVMFQNTTFVLKINDDNSKCYYLSSEWQDLLLERHLTDYCEYCFSMAKERASNLKYLQRHNKYNVAGANWIYSALLTNQELVKKCKDALNDRTREQSFDIDDLSM